MSVNPKLKHGSEQTHHTYNIYYENCLSFTRYLVSWRVQDAQDQSWSYSKPQECWYPGVVLRDSN